MSRFSKENASPAVWRILMAIEWAQIVNEHSVKVEVADLKEFLSEAEIKDEFDEELDDLRSEVHDLEDKVDDLQTDYALLETKHNELLEAVKKLRGYTHDLTVTLGKIPQ